MKKLLKVDEQDRLAKAFEPQPQADLNDMPAGGPFISKEDADKFYKKPKQADMTLLHQSKKYKEGK